MGFLLTEQLLLRHITGLFVFFDEKLVKKSFGTYLRIIVFCFALFTLIEKVSWEHLLIPYVAFKLGG